MSRGGGSLFVPRGGIPFSDINDVIEAHLNAPSMGRKGERYCLVSANKSFKEAALTFSSSCRVERRPGAKRNYLNFHRNACAAWPVGSAKICSSRFRLKDGLTWQQAWLANKKIFFKSDKAVAELAFKPTPNLPPYYGGPIKPEQTRLLFRLDLGSP